MKRIVMTQLKVICVLFASILFQVNSINEKASKCKYTPLNSRGVYCVNSTFEDLKRFLENNKFELDENSRITFTESIFNEINDKDLSNDLIKNCTFNFQNNHIKKLYIDTLMHIDQFEMNTIDLFTIEKYTSLLSTKFLFKSSLRKINITKNVIKSIDTNVFANVSSILNIVLPSNQLTDIKSHTFANLREILMIDLSHNNLSRLHEYTFVNFTKSGDLYTSDVIGHIDLSHNQISVLEFNTFYNLEEDIHVNLEYNNITTLDGGIFTNVKLKALMLSHNQINYISSKFFENMELVQELRLSNNQIKTLSSDLFLPLKGLQRLSLLGNPIKSIQRDAFVGLRRIDSYLYSNTQFLLGELSVSVIPSGAFNGLLSLRQLDLSNWNITCIESKAFFHVPQLKNLNLRHNQLIKIEAGAFYGLKEIEEIDLAFNRLQKITKDMFEGLTDTTFSTKLNSELEYWDEDYFGLYDYGDFEDIGLILNLKHNEISTIESDAFTYLSRLRELDLSRNHIKTIPIGTFNDLKFMTELNLQQNNLTVLETEVLYPMTRLKDLNLAENHLESLDIRALMEHFNGALKTIDLNDNKWKCEDLRWMILFLIEKKVDFSSPAPDYFNSDHVYGIDCFPSKDDYIDEDLSFNFNVQSVSDASSQLKFITYHNELIQNYKILISIGVLIINIIIVN